MPLEEVLREIRRMLTVGGKEVGQLRGLNVAWLKPVIRWVGVGEGAMTGSFWPNTHRADGRVLARLRTGWLRLGWTWRLE